jgi:hypothetical protein
MVQLHQEEGRPSPTCQLGQGGFRCQRDAAGSGNQASLLPAVLLFAMPHEENVHVRSVPRSPYVGYG